MSPKERKDLLNKSVVINELQSLEKDILDLERARVKVKNTVSNFTRSNRRKAKPIFFSTIPNSNVTYPEVVEEPVAVLRVPTFYVAEWPVSNDETDVISSSLPVAMAQYKSEEWGTVELSPNLASISGVGNLQSRINCIESRGNNIWIVGRGGVTLLSKDGGVSWTENLPTITGQRARSIQYDASGRLWRVEETLSNIIEIYRSDGGLGDEDWELIETINGDVYLSDSSSWGWHRAIACHPTDPDIIVVTYSDYEIAINLQHVHITLDGGETWTTTVLPGQLGEFPWTPPSGDMFFTSQGRLIIVIESEEDGGDFLNYHWSIYSDEPYNSFTSVQLLPDEIASHFGFSTKACASPDGEKIYVSFGRSLESDSGGFDGLKTYIAVSEDAGETFTELCTFIQPTGEIIDMPGYSEGLWYDSVNDEVWVFFTPFEFLEEGGTEIFGPYLIQKIDADGNKFSLREDISLITGLETPYAMMACVIG